MSEKKERTAVQKMRELYFGIKNSRTPSKKLTDLMKKNKSRHPKVRPVTDPLTR